MLKYSNGMDICSALFYYVMVEILLPDPPFN